MISFYPGPSRIHDEIPAYVTDAYNEGILSASHRSDAFVALSKQTIELLQEKLRIPNDYTVFFTSSATECWEIIAQSLIKDKSHHFYNGAFGQKWFDYTKRLRNAESLPFNLNEKPDLTQLGDISDSDLICVTQNETSNGTQLGNRVIRSIRKQYPDALIAVDATSSMAGIRLDFKTADIWYASVQKCFGLPAGLGVMVCSPKAVHQAAEIGEKDHYNSLTFMTEMMKKWQTSYTPNVMGIYLLKRVLEDSDTISKTHEKTVKRYEAWVDFLAETKTLKHLVKLKEVRSYTVIPVSAQPDIVQQIKNDARKEGLLLGEGYGQWKNDTFRIANFPALKKKEIKKLMKFLQKY